MFYIVLIVELLFSIIAGGTLVVSLTMYLADKGLLKSQIYNTLLCVVISTTYLSIMIWYNQPSVEERFCPLLSNYELNHVPFFCEEQKYIYAHFLILDSDWQSLLGEYIVSSTENRNDVANDLSAISKTDQLKLKNEENREINLIRDFVQAWKISSVSTWDAFIASHKNDETADIAYYERQKIINDQKTKARKK